MAGNEVRIDLREINEERMAEGKRSAQLCFRINQTMPLTEECDALIHELLPHMGEGCRIMPPLQINLGENVKLGKGVSIMYNLLCMAAGGITIEDDAMIAANVSLISNNHDFKERAIITCKPIVIKKKAWIGANATILPGVTIGENAIVAAGAVVSRDVPANTVAAGIPAKVIKEIE